MEKIKILGGTATPGSSTVANDIVNNIKSAFSAFSSSSFLSDFTSTNSVVKAPLQTQATNASGASAIPFQATNLFSTSTSSISSGSGDSTSNDYGTVFIVLNYNNSVYRMAQTTIDLSSTAGILINVPSPSGTEQPTSITLYIVYDGQTTSVSL